MRPLTACVLVIVGLPIAWPLAGALTTPPADPLRLAELATTAAALVTLAVGIAVVPGVLWGVGLGRGGRWAWAVVAVGVAVPLTVQAVAWQVATAGLVDWATRAPGEAAAWRPWRYGLGPAAFVHGMAGVPWVAAAVGIMLKTVDRRLWEMAILDGGPRQAARRVLLPRAARGAVLGGCAVALQAATEVAVTDVMQLRTAAEEVYTQFTRQATGEAAATLTVPWTLLSATLLALVVGPLVPGLVAGLATEETPWRLPPTGERILWALRITGGVAAVGVPVVALVWRAARPGGLGAFAERMLGTATTEGATLAGSAGAAVACGVACVGLAVPVVIALRVRPRLVKYWLAFALIVAATPGPVVGVGLKQVIALLLTLEERLTGPGVVADWLYYRPSPLPAVWLGVVRFFPVAFLGCLLRAWLVAPGLIEQSRLDGLTGLTRLRVLVGPAVAGTGLVLALVVAALALGEVSGSRLVDPPGRGTYALRLLNQMHYGAESIVAAMALLQVAAAGLCVAAAFPGKEVKRASEGSA